MLRPMGDNKSGQSRSERLPDVVVVASATMAAWGSRMPERTAATIPRGGIGYVLFLPGAAAIMTAIGLYTSARK